MKKTGGQHFFLFQKNKSLKEKIKEKIINDEK